VVEMRDRLRALGMADRIEILRKSNLARYVLILTTSGDSGRPTEGPN